MVVFRELKACNFECFWMLFTYPLLSFLSSWGRDLEVKIKFKKLKVHVWCALAIVSECVWYSLSAKAIWIVLLYLLPTVSRTVRKCSKVVYCFCLLSVTLEKALKRYFYYSRKPVCVRVEEMSQTHILCNYLHTEGLVRARNGIRNKIPEVKFWLPCSLICCWGTGQSEPLTLGAEFLLCIFTWHSCASALCSLHSQMFHLAPTGWWSQQFMLTRGTSCVFC